MPAQRRNGRALRYRVYGEPDREGGIPPEIVEMCRQAKALRDAIVEGQRRVKATGSDEDRRQYKRAINDTKTFLGAQSGRFMNILDRYTNAQVDVLFTCLESLARAYGKEPTTFSGLRYNVARRLGLPT
jgi:hypothetical protein